jgi:hypothetical protein
MKSIQECQAVYYGRKEKREINIRNVTDIVVAGE